MELPFETFFHTLPYEYKKFFVLMKAYENDPRQSFVYEELIGKIINMKVLLKDDFKTPVCSIKSPTILETMKEMSIKDKFKLKPLDHPEYDPFDEKLGEWASDFSEDDEEENKKEE